MRPTIRRKRACPLVGAIGSVSAGLPCTLGFLGEGAALIRQPVADSVHGVGFQPFKELLAQVVEAKVPIYI
jgi:predicted peroxiredoxin